MRKTVFYALLCIGGLALPAIAQRPQINDATYVGVARCQGLYDSTNLSPRVDPAGINRFMDREGSGRDPIVMDEARDARSAAGRDAANASGNEKAKLVAERDGPCRRWSRLGPPSGGAPAP